jgi:drug/metabolite transporter (DMT)-like permease
MSSDETFVEHRRLGYGLAAAATMIWAGNYVIARGIHERIPPVTLASWRWALAVVFLLPFALRELLSQWQLVRRHWRYLSFAALLGVTMLNTFVYIAGHTTQAIKLSLITTSAPVLTILLASFLNQERVTLTKGTGISLAAAGVAILMFTRSPATSVNLSFSWADLWVVMAAIAFAGYTILVERKPPEMGTRTFLLSIFTLGWIFLTPFYIWERLALEPWVFDPVVVGSLLYLALGASLVAFVAWNSAVALVGPQLQR